MCIRDRYRDAMYMLIDSENKPEYYTESNIEYRALRAFFDIYENKDKNAQIVECAMKVSGSPFSRSADNETIEELALLLPCTEPLAQQYMGCLLYTSLLKMFWLSLDRE